MIPSASCAASTAASGRAYPETEGHGRLGPRSHAPDEARQRRAAGCRAPLSPRPRRRSTRNRSPSRRRARHGRRSRSARRAGRSRRRHRPPAEANRPASSTGRSGITSPDTPARAASCKNTLGPAREDNVVVEQEDHGYPSREHRRPDPGSSRGQHRSRGRASRSPGSSGPSASGSEKGTPISSTSAPASR